ncbi:MAG: ATP-binding protein [Betaproteobacteria bacterium]|nr:MAG: ATP-binding protein [Betaproteobacteria bacterium]
MFERNLAPQLLEALADTPVVALTGARQTGKSTLAQQIAARIEAGYWTLDDAATHAAAASDPVGFIRGLGRAAVIDEAQKAPGLFAALKAEVDRDRRPGRFLLTGSADVRTLPAISESLAGRIEFATLWPLSQGEIHGRRERFIDALFARELPRLGRSPAGERSIEAMVAAGGYPEALARAVESRREAWFSSYIATLLQRDVRDLARIDGLTELPRLLRLLAARSAALLNASEISRSSGIANTTLKRYLALLELVFLVRPLAAWSTNLGKRLVKSPKLHLVDSGLAAHLLGLSAQRLAQDRHALGALLESFVVGELRKQAAWAETRVSLGHFRSPAGAEVDVVLEDRRGRVAGVEVKASASVGRRDFSGLLLLQQSLRARFACGVVLYTGEQAVPFGDRLIALPVSALWRVA